MRIEDHNILTFLQDLQVEIDLLQSRGLVQFEALKNVSITEEECINKKTYRRSTLPSVNNNQIEGIILNTEFYYYYILGFAGDSQSKHENLKLELENCENQSYHHFHVLEFLEDYFLEIQHNIDQVINNFKKQNNLSDAYTEVDLIKRAIEIYRASMETDLVVDLEIPIRFSKRISDLILSSLISILHERLVVLDPNTPFKQLIDQNKYFESKSMATALNNVISKQYQKGKSLSVSQIVILLDKLRSHRIIKDFTNQDLAAIGHVLTGYNKEGLRQKFSNVLSLEQELNRKGIKNVEVVATYIDKITKDLEQSQKTYN